MAKFPDPTKNYTAEPVSSAINFPEHTTSPSSTSSEPSLPTQVYTAPTTPPPSKSSASPESTASPPASSSPPAPDLSSVVSPSPFRNFLPLILGIGVFLVLAVLGFALIPKFFGKKNEPITLTYWGLWEPASVMQTVIADYERDHPNIKINYTMQSSTNYRSRLQSALTSSFADASVSSNSPDIMRIHNTWLPMLRKNLAPKPESVVLDISEYYPVVKNDFVRNNQLYAVPLEIDGLALYSNTDILNELAATPPTDWNTLRTLAFNLTQRNPDTNIIKRAGLAMGTTNNVDNWSDILGLLILQNSGHPGNPADPAVQQALTFYTNFSVLDKSWDSTQPNSTYAFATGTVAMMLAPAWRVTEIRALNPTLNFAITPSPTLSSVNVAWATYWAEAVAAGSKHPIEAWQFLSYLSTPAVLQKLYTTESQLRPIGEPYPLVSQAPLLAQDPLAAAFISQAPNYRSWYLSSQTKDEGINDEIIQYYQDAVNAINQGSSVSSVTQTLNEGVAQILSKYQEAR